MKSSSLHRLLGLKGDLSQFTADMNTQRERFGDLAGRHENGTTPKAVSVFNLFQTPKDIAQRMAGIVQQHCGMSSRILEPSAGLGRIYSAVIDTLPGSRVSLVEQSAECAGELYRIARDGDRLFQRDFLEVSPEEIGFFDAICMNPPFKQGLDIKHIMHAKTFLAPGGVLVSLCYNGARQNAFLKPLATSWDVLPDNSFRAEGTTASVCLLIIQ